MNTADKLNMYKEKKGFIAAISQMLKSYKPKGLTISKIEYEVYKTPFGSYMEWIVVTYYGGGYTAKLTNGNSNTANFRVIAGVLDGGDYSEVHYYEEIKATSEVIEV